MYENKNVNDKKYEEFTEELKANVNKFTKKVNNENESKETYSYYSNVLKKPFADLNELKQAEAKAAAAKKEKEDEKVARALEADKVTKSLDDYRAAIKNARSKVSEAKAKHAKAVEAANKEYQNELNAIDGVVDKAKQKYLNDVGAFNKKYGGFHTTFRDGDSIVEVEMSNAFDESIIDDMFDMFNFLLKL